MQKIHGPMVTLKIKQEDVDELDRIAKRVKLNRNQLIRNCVEVGLDIMHGYEKIGVIKLIEINRRTMKAIKEETQPGLFKA